MSHHHCHANYCQTPTARRLFMCPRHWAMVPPRMQAAVWSTFHESTQATRSRYAPYLTACAVAVEHVALTEGKPQHNSYRRILKTLDEIAANRRAEECKR